MFLTFVSVYHSAPSSYWHVSSVQLNLFQRLTFLTYGSYLTDSVLPYAIRQLQAYTPTAPVNITFDIVLNRCYPDPYLYWTLDGILYMLSHRDATFNFHETISPLLFPSLDEATMFVTLTDSFWECEVGSRYAKSILINWSSDIEYFSSD